MIETILWSIQSTTSVQTFTALRSKNVTPRASNMHAGGKICLPEPWIWLKENWIYLQEESACFVARRQNWVCLLEAESAFQSIEYTSRRICVSLNPFLARHSLCFSLFLSHSYFSALFILLHLSLSQGRALSLFFSILSLTLSLSHTHTHSTSLSLCLSLSLPHTLRTLFLSLPSSFHFQLSLCLRNLLPLYL